MQNKNDKCTQQSTDLKLYQEEKRDAESIQLLRMGEQPRRNHKDSTFCLLFSEPQRAVELYNAICDDNLPPDTELIYTTLQNAIYVDRSNDLGFIIKGRHLVLSECQSTINENIPMRCLGYISRTLENLTGKEGLYGRNLVKFPAPEFYLFYVGKETWERKKLTLSESYLVQPKENSMELVVNLINLNYTEGKEILQRSPSLLGYSKLLYYIQAESKANGGDLKEAIDAAVESCIEEGLLADFLQRHSREVTGMLFKEITVEEFAEIRAREAYADGEKAGEKSGFSKGEKAGERKAALEIARNLKGAGIPEEVIAANTGLTAAEIEAL